MNPMIMNLESVDFCMKIEEGLPCHALTSIFVANFKIINELLISNSDEHYVVVLYCEALILGH